jgi:hypothetical protein
VLSYPVVAFLACKARVFELLAATKAPLALASDTRVAELAADAVA